MRVCPSPAALRSATLLVLCAAELSRSAPLLPEDIAAPGSAPTGMPPAPEDGGSRRDDKALEYYQYLLPPFVDDGDLYGQVRSQEARTEPLLGRKEPLYPDSPIYYIRLPPSPYMYVPGLGYVSQPSQQTAPQAVNPFISLPVNFLANGKPSNIYQWSSPGDYRPAPPSTTPPPPVQPPQQSSVVNLDKGPYVFNGRPSDIYVLRDSYNSLYADALQNFYP